jgi:AcrR family transcriptional regulator
MDRRTRVADAALDVVAAHGMKGLTHRAVDAASGSPAGTTSNYYRTRTSLVAAAVDRLEQRDLEVWSGGAQLPPPADPDALANRLAAYLAVFVTEQADLTRARLVLSLSDPAAVVAGHRRFMAVARAMVESAGLDDAEERARWLADYCDGVLLHQLTTRHDEHVDVASHRRAIRRLLLD